MDWTRTDLQTLRLKTGLTQAELAKKSGLSIRSIQKFEAGEEPNEDSQMRIESALSGQPAPDSPKLASSPEVQTRTSWPDWYIDETYDPIRAAREYAHILRTANGAAVDNRWLWSTPQQCMDWLDVVRTGHLWHHRMMSWPYRSVAQAIMMVAPTKEIDVIAIGPGMGLTELNLIRELIAIGARVRIVLIDLSADLLISCSRMFAGALHGVQLCKIHGEGYHVDRWPWLVDPARARVWLSLGHASHDMVDVEALHRAAQPGDVLVADICSSYQQRADIVEPMHRWVRRALGRLDIHDVDIGVLSSRTIHPHQDWLTATIGTRTLRLGRVDLRSSENSRHEADSRGVQTVALVPAMRDLAEADVWVGRRIGVP